MFFSGVKHWKFKNFKLCCRKQSYEKYRIKQKLVNGKVRTLWAGADDPNFMPRMRKDKEFLRDIESEDETVFDEEDDEAKEKREMEDRARALTYFKEHGEWPNEDVDGDDDQHIVRSRDHEFHMDDDDDGSDVYLSGNDD